MSTDGEHATRVMTNLDVPDAVPSPDAHSMFLSHYLGLVRLSRLLVDDRETAEEIVQDVFAAMQSRWRDFADAEAALRYLRTSVVNRSRSALRFRRRWRALVLQAPRDVAPAEDDALSRLEYLRMQRAVAALPRRQREVVVLRYYQDLPVAEVARILRISQGAVKSSTSRALDSLQTLMRTMP